MKKVALHNLGCKVNAYETEAMQEILEQNGYEETELLIASTDGSKGDLVKLTIGGKDRNYIVTYKRDSRRTAVEVMER